MTSQPSPTVSESWNREYIEWLASIQDRTLALTVPALVLLGIIILSRIHPAPPVRTGVLAGTLFVLAGLVALLRRRRPAWTATILVVGLLSVTLAAIIWLTFPEAIVLILLPAGLATLLISRAAGLGLAVACSLAAILLPNAWLPISSELRVISLIGVWGTVGMVLATVGPLITAAGWAWAAYEQSYDVLEENREYQVRLSETLEDLQQANQQLTRLNRLAQGLRQVAEDERRAKEEFVANVSHELRTPLNMIVGFCEMITQSPETYGGGVPQSLLADLEVVLRNSEHLSGLIDDVLDLSQIEADQMALTKERVSLDEIIASAIIGVRPLFESKDLYLHAEVDDDLPEIFCDRMRIREVILNLLSNAGRFTEEGGVVIKAWAASDHLTVSVTDTGPGIPETARQRLFRPFQQLDNTIRRRYGGTGLGLSISKSFVELHDGQMWVESEEGQGTTFYFSLPIDPLPPLQTESALRWFNPYEPYEDRGRAWRLKPEELRPRWVVVEAGNALERLISRYMDQIELAKVSRWSEAVREVSETPAQAVLVNALDTGTMLEQIRSSPPLPYGIATLICSVPGVEQAVDDLGVTDYLVKPISREDLLAALDHLAHPVRTVLVVDDEPDALRLFWRMLSSADRGYRMLRASDGRQALEHLSQERPDVILLDLMMPEMDGFHFLSLRRRRPDLQEIPVILISARDPLGHPIVTNALAMTTDRGLSVRELLSCIEAFTAIVARGPNERSEPPEKPGG